MMASELYPYTGFLVMMFWALLELAHRFEIVREANKIVTFCITLAVSVALSFTPLNGISLSAFVLSFIPVFSSASLFVAIIFIIKLYSGKDPIKEREWSLLLIAGGGYTLVLMLSALGLIPFDLYSAGYGDIWFMGFLALSTLALALRSSQLTWWLLAAPALWWIEAVPSGNINDALTDVCFLVLCIVIFTRRLRKSPAPVAPVAPVAIKII